MKPLQNHKNKKYVPETTGQYKKSREAVIESLGIFLLSARLYVAVATGNFLKFLKAHFFDIADFE